METSGFIDEESNLYTNLAFWFSDQYNIDTKVAIYQGLDRAVFRTKKEFTGSIIEQIDEVVKYFDLCNEVKIIIDGDPIRKEFPSYNKIAAREAILNCYCHHDYSRKSNIKIEFFDDRCEILSPGGFYGGLTLEKALEGYQSFRNEKLVKLLFKLGYIENYASGLSRIYSIYKDEEIKPSIDTSLIGFKITFPNKNYDILEMIDKLKLAKVTDKVTENEIEIIRLLMMNPEYTLVKMSEMLCVSRKTMAKRIKCLREKGVIERVGAIKMDIGKYAKKDYLNNGQKCKNNFYLI